MVDKTKASPGGQTAPTILLAFPIRLLFLPLVTDVLALSSSFAPLRVEALATPTPPPPQMTSAASRLRTMIAPSSDRVSPHSAIALPGVHDALSARIFASSGAQALFLSGFGVSGCRLGEPDAGVLTYAEMEDATRAVVSAVASACRGGMSMGTPVIVPPVIVDGDTGYGGASNIRRTVRGLAAAGAAAITIEDQKFPKRCTYAAGAGVRVVSREQSVDRIRAAIGARDEARELDGNDVLIIARTDCRAALGVDEAVERCRAYEEEGADIVYAENLQSREEYMALRENLRPGTPMMLAQVQQGLEGENLYSVEEVGEMGYSLALFGVTALQATVRTLHDTAANFLSSKGGGGGGVLDGDTAKSLASFVEVKEAVGFLDLEDFEGRFKVEA